MNNTSFEGAWNAQPHDHITIDLDLLVNEVRRNDQQFRANILARASNWNTNFCAGCA